MISNRDYKAEAVNYCNNKYGGGLNLKGNKRSKYTLFSKEFFSYKIMAAYYQYIMENLSVEKPVRNDLQGNLSYMGYTNFISLDGNFQKSKRFS